MKNDTTRFTLSISADIAAKAEGLKENTFYDKSYSEMYRQLIRLGMDALEEKREEKSCDENI